MPIRDEIETLVNDQDPYGVHGIKFEDAKKFLAFLDDNDNWIHPDRTSSDWIFRGARNASWRLIPSSMREDNEYIERLKQHVQAGMAGMKSRLRGHIKRYYQHKHPIEGDLAIVYSAPFEEILMQLGAERRAIFEFMEAADACGFQIPTDDHSEEIKTVLLEDYLIKAIDDCYARKANDTDAVIFDPLADFVKGQVVGLAKHHEIPARIVDWTTIPLKAAFFAALGAHEALDNEDQDDYIVVWALRRGTDRFRNEIEYFTSPRGINNYLHEQDGLFCYAPLANSHYLETGVWRPIDQIVLDKTRMDDGTDQSMKYLFKILMHKSQVEEVLRRLDGKKIARRYLMPTLDNVANDLKQFRWR